VFAMCLLFAFVLVSSFAGSLQATHRDLGRDSVHCFRSVQRENSDVTLPPEQHNRFTCHGVKCASAELESSSKKTNTKTIDCFVFVFLVHGKSKKDAS
jgi:hypothetical protein